MTIRGHSGLLKTLTIWFLLLFSSVTSSLGPEGQGPKSGVLRRIVSCNEPADDDDGVGEHVAVIVSYRVPQIVALGRFPDAREFDLTWRTEEVRHVGSDTIAPRFWCVASARFGEEDEVGPQARRLLALAAIYDGATRTEALRKHAKPRLNDQLFAS